MEMTRDESNRVFIHDFIRLCRLKGIRTSTYDTSGAAGTEECDICKNLNILRPGPPQARIREKRIIRKASSAIGENDWRFMKGIAAELITAGTCKSRFDHLKSCVDKCGPTESTRRTRAIQSAADAFSRHNTCNVAKITRDLLDPRRNFSSTKKNRLFDTLVKREFSRCYTLNKSTQPDGTPSLAIHQKHMCRVAHPEISDYSSTCMMMYREVVSSHKTGRSMRIQALLSGANRFPSNWMKARNATSRSLFKIDHEVFARYGTASVVKCELGAFHKMDELLRDIVGLSRGAVDFAHGWMENQGKIHKIDASVFENNSDQILDVCSECRILVQHMTQCGDYNSLANRDGTSGGPRNWNSQLSRNWATPNKNTFDELNSTLFYMYGVFLYPEMCTESHRGRRARSDPGSLIIECDAIRWTLAEKWRKEKTLF